ncbi:MAG: HAMP domain-containing sensor histidine kinase [Kofleriaceae bacterium]
MARPRATILVKLLVAFALPTVALFGLFAYVAYTVTRDDLDAELGTRMAAVAASAATQVRGKYLTELVAGDEEDRGYLNVQQKLRAVAEATGARLFVFDRDFVARVDTEPGVAIGTRYYQAELDRHELARVFADGAAVASVTFEGTGGRMYKAGYAPVRASETEPEIVLAIGAQAPAGYFARLSALRRSLLLWGGALVVVVLGATIGAAYMITRNVRRLAAAAERIGRGELATPVRVRGRDELGLLGATMDEMRAQLAERDARLQQMLAGIAHEVRNPLAGMTLFTGILQDELPADGDARAHVDKIARELGYLERVVTEFLDYARRPPPETEAVAVRGLLDEVAQVTGDPARGVAVVIEPGDGVVRGDRAQLRRALLNLVHNAVAATPTAPTGPAAVVALPPPVRLAVVGDGDQLVVRVDNHGPAIPEVDRARIFEPFFTTRERGTGLGLAFVRDIARAHGGEVTVGCAAGVTRFELRLPRAG